MGKGVGFPLAAADDDDCDCNLPGPDPNAIGGGSGIGDDGDEAFAAGIPLFREFSILKFPGNGGGGGPEIKNESLLIFFHALCYLPDTI